MKPGFAEAHLRCPVCRAERSLVLRDSASDDWEVREGELRCRACTSAFPVERGVAGLLVDAPEHVSREAAGLERFAAQMKAEGWTADAIRRLPYANDGYWYVQATSMHQLLSTVDFQPGQTVLDIGSNTCWASRMFAERGLHAIALDITTADFQGLYTSDLFLAGGEVYFERVMASMNDMPLASSSVDYVFCCEVLHHNDKLGLRRTMAEAYRVLKPGGQLLVINETLKTLRDRSGVHTEGVEQFDGYEHAHWAVQYRWAAMRAGFRTRLLPPMYHPPFNGNSLLARLTRRGKRLAARLDQQLVSTRLGRSLPLMWLIHVAGGVQFSMIATKRR